MKYDFIEIGTSDFDTLIGSTTGKIGISIEPLKFYLDNLPDNDLVIKLNCAITDFDGLTDVYWIDPKDIIEHDLPQWLRGCNSIIKPHPTALRILNDEGLSHIYKKTKCRCFTWQTIVDLYDVKYIDFLKIDTEGHDYVIINNILKLNKSLPKRIQFESNVLTSKLDTENTLYNLKLSGYSVVKIESDNIIVERY